MENVSVLAVLAVVLFLAFLVESLVEYLLGAIIANVHALEPYKWLTIYVAAIVGIVGAFTYGFDLLSLLGQYLGITITITIFGKILTGLAIGRGANYIHDIVSRYFVKPKV
jgi:hypothetical protein